MMNRHAGLVTLVCLAVACAWLGNWRDAGAEEQKKWVRVQVRTQQTDAEQSAAAAAGDTQSPDGVAASRTITVMVTAGEDLGERVAEILKAAGLEGDKLDDTRDKILKAVNENSGVGGRVLPRIQAPQVTVVGPDGKPQKIELRRFAVEGGTASPWFDRVRKHVEEALEKAGLDEKQREQVRKALDQASQIKVPQVTAFGPEGLRVEARSLAQDAQYMIGLQCATLEEDQRTALKLPEGQGLAVVSVFEDTPAEEAGIQAGDVLVKVDNQDVAGVEALVAAVQKAGKEQKKLALQLMRDGKKRTVHVVPAKRESLEVSVQVLDDDTLEGIKKRLPGGVKPEMFFWKQVPGGISGIGPGVITPWRAESADESTVEELKKQIEELSTQVKQLQTQLEKLKADKD
jgi:hypothetical protein